MYFDPSKSAATVLVSVLCVDFVDSVLAQVYLIYIVNCDQVPVCGQQQLFRRDFEVDFEVLGSLVVKQLCVRTLCDQQ